MKPRPTRDEQTLRDAEFDALPRWRRGEVVPAAITQWLDLRGLYGPDVDLACGAVEPAVDQWEAGERYPTWPQLTALARLCRVPVTAFFQPVPQLAAIFVCTTPRSRSYVSVDNFEQVDCYSRPVWQPVVDGITDTLFDLPPSGALL